MSATASVLVAACWNHAQTILQSYWQNITSFTAIQSFITSCIQDPNLLLSYYKNTDPLEITLYLSTFCTTMHYILAEITKNYSQVDRSWSILPAVYAWHFVFHDRLLSGSYHPRLLAAATIITIWGARLTYNFARKGGYYWTGQDYRFIYLRKNLGPFKMGLLNLVFIAPIQNIILVLIVTPLTITNYLLSNSSDREICLSILDVTTVALFLSFLFFEAVADEQQYFFQTEKYALLNYLKRDELKGDYKLGFLWNSGLFQYSRHPNFFAEQSMWWVVYLFSVAAIQEASGMSDSSTFFNWTLSAPIILTILFQGSTGITEQISKEKYPEYEEYCKSVSKLIPWFPSNKTTHNKKD